MHKAGPMIMIVAYDYFRKGFCYCHLCILISLQFATFYII